VEVVKGGTEALGLEVAVRLTDSSVLRGWILAGITGKLEPTLNKEAPFIEFVGADGRRTFIAKSQIATVEPIEPLKKPELNARGGGNVTCHDLLGLPANCTFDEARDNYHRLVKLYHPDLYSNSSLPPEITRYATEMFSQISAAYAEIRQKFNQVA
jgi:hypothetical protein